jgi:exopolyphosphatase / guanosine-5'-triphosphate,3'-diphosphate pyrophosphatase
MAAERVAAIDIGTNSVLLVVAERDPSGMVQVVLDRATITRLGQGVDKTKCLAPEAVARTLDCLRSYAAILRESDVERLRVVGTSALRDVPASASFTTRAAKILGVSPQIIAGTLEAELTFRGALSGLGLAGPVTVVDIGGGSTEIILGEASDVRVRADIFRSVDVGCVRLTERHVSTDPPTNAELVAVANSMRQALHTVGNVPHDGTLVAVAGTATTLAAVHLDLSAYDSTKVHGCVLSRQVVDNLVDRLSQLSQAQRHRVVGLDPQRADVIVAGGVMLATTLDVFGCDRVTVSDRGVRFGLIEALFDEG